MYIWQKTSTSHFFENLKYLQNYLMMKLTTRARVPLHTGSQKYKRMLDFLNKKIHIFQSWLNHLLDDHELNNITKLKKKRKKREKREKNLIIRLKLI